MEDVHWLICECDKCVGQRFRGKLPPLPDYTFNPTTGEFPVIGNIEFSRTSDGDVQVQFGNTNPVTILAAEWCSIVAHVSAGEGKAEDYDVATTLHTEGGWYPAKQETPQ